MRTSSVLRIAALCLTIVLMVLLRSQIAFGQGGYPQPTDKYVNDYAKVITSSDEKSIRTMLADLEAQTGIEATVLTINSIYDYDTDDKTIESFATNLFNTWGIGDREKNNGFMILVAVDDRRVRIELGSGYSSEMDQAMQRVINEDMLPYFRQADYSQGIYEGTRAGIDALAGGPQLLPDRTTQTLTTDKHKVQLMFWVPLFIVIGIIVVLKMLVDVYRNERESSPRRRRSRRDDTHYGGGFGGGSSGGGGSFGGGGSAGGGASGSW
jgi:uncharacterized membrane protein YgcG